MHGISRNDFPVSEGRHTVIAAEEVLRRKPDMSDTTMIQTNHSAQGPEPAVARTPGAYRAQRGEHVASQRAMDLRAGGSDGPDR